MQPKAVGKLLKWSIKGNRETSFAISCDFAASYVFGGVSNCIDNILVGTKRPKEYAFRFLLLLLLLIWVMMTSWKTRVAKLNQAANKPGLKGNHSHFFG